MFRTDSMIRTSDRVFLIANKMVLSYLNGRILSGFLLFPVITTSWMWPHSRKDLKQSRPSQMTMHLGWRCSSAQAWFASDEKALTLHNLIWVIYAFSFRLETATKKVFPGVPRLRLPPQFLPLQLHIIDLNQTIRFHLVISSRNQNNERNYIWWYYKLASIRYIELPPQ